MNDSLIKIMAQAILPLIRPAIEEIVKKELELNEVSTQTQENGLISKNKTKEILNVSDPTLWRWEKASILVPVRIGTKVFYRKEDLDGLKK